MADVDPEELPAEQRSSEQAPLLPSDRREISALRTSGDWITGHILRVHGEGSRVLHLRRSLQDSLASKWGHYFVIFLVSVDVSCIFANFLISLHVCEHDGEKGFNKKQWLRADDVLDHVSLAFSCLFMAELIASVFAFGFSYFSSKFHIFDATVIVAGFMIDVVLRGQIEEAGSLIVVGRLWRVFKIIEEFSSGAEDQLEALQEKLERVEQEKEKLLAENITLKKNVEISGGVLSGH